MTSINHHPNTVTPSPKLHYPSLRDSCHKHNSYDDAPPWQRHSTNGLLTAGNYSLEAVVEWCERSSLCVGAHLISGSISNRCKAAVATAPWCEEKRPVFLEPPLDAANAKIKNFLGKFGDRQNSRKFRRIQNFSGRCSEVRAYVYRCPLTTIRWALPLLKRAIMSVASS